MDTSRIDAQTVTQRLTAGLRTHDGCPIPVQVELSYRADDPFAVTFSFHPDHTPVLWVFGRDLLTAGLVEPSGDGDVHVWPCLDDDGRAVVCIDLCSPYGDALLELGLAEVFAFVERTFTVVSPGGESPRLDVDSAIRTIFATGTF